MVFIYFQNVDRDLLRIMRHSDISMEGKVCYCSDDLCAAGASNARVHMALMVSTPLTVMDSNLWV